MYSENTRGQHIWSVHQWDDLSRLLGYLRFDNKWRGDDFVLPCYPQHSIHDLDLSKTVPLFEKIDTAHFRIEIIRFDNVELFVLKTKAPMELLKQVRGFYAFEVKSTHEH